MVENILCMTSVLLNSLRPVLWPGILSVLENVPHVLGKNVHSAAVGRSGLCLIVCSSLLFPL